MKYTLTLLGLCAATCALGQQVEMIQPKPYRPATSQVNAPVQKVVKGPISGDLQQVYRYASGAEAGGTSRGAGAVSAPALQAAFPMLLVQGSSGPAAVLVRITARNVTALRPLLEARGFVTTAARPDLNFLEGQLPVSQLAPGAAGIGALAAQGLLGVRPVHRPLTHAGRVQNQADYLLESYRVRGAAGGYSGRGLRIGVMSDSYNALGGAAAGVASGDLPANVQVLQDLATDGADEGRAMIELMHDIAPDAGMAFSSVFYGEANFADQLLKLADPTLGNCKIIVDDISYFDEPMFQDGVVAQAVNEAASRLGIAYFSSAGNEADYSCEYTVPVFKPLTAAAATGNADLDFGASFSTGGASDTRQHYSIPKTGSILLELQWSDPFYTRAGVRTDLDMYLIKTRANGVVMRGDTVAVSGDDNIQTQTPSELLYYVNNNDTDTEFDLVISRYQGTANPARVKYIDFGDGANIAPAEYFTHSGTVVGHHAATGAMAVAAAPSYNRLAPEGFTSKGQPTYLFAADGTPLAAPTVRLKPDFTSIDGVSTTFFGSVTPDPKDGSLFFGTSAAAPNAAAVAALLLQAQPSLTPAQVSTRLQSTALDISTAGFDALTGAGLIDAYRAIYGSVVPAAAPFTETFNTTGLSAAWDIQGRGPVRSIVRSDYGPASTPGHLVLDGFFPYYNFYDYSNGPRVAEATLHLNLSTAAAGGYVLAFRQKKFTGEVDNAMPLTFANNSAGSLSDGVAMSVDGGATWYRVADLTGTNSSTTYQLVSVNLSTLATANSLTLGSDVLIRFQRSGSGQVDSYSTARQGGRAFDDITVAGANATSAPVAQFNAATSSICPGSSVQYRDASLFAPTSYAWSFPGGTPATSTDPNPIVTYATAGTYDATLTVTNASGSSTRTLTAVVTVSSVVPVANFTARRAPLCPGGKITFTNTSTQCVSSLSWSFPGGTPATSTDPNPIVTYAATGTYTATLTATNANGSSTKTFTVQVQGAALAIPYAEPLASGIPSAWSVINPDNGITWASTANILRKDGTRGAAVDMDFFDYTALSQRDTLQTPTFDLRNQSLAFLRFDVAYAPVSNVPTAYNDSLAVDVYTACTNTRLGRVYLKSAVNGLPTTLFRETVYAPTSVTQWRTENVSLAAYLNQQLYLRFVAFNHHGNHLYLANVGVSNTVLATQAPAESVALQAFPNPVAGGQSLLLLLPQSQGTATVQVLDALGRRVWYGTAALQAATATRLALAAPVSAGIYTVLCQTADGQLYSRRVAVE